MEAQLARDKIAVAHAKEVAHIERVLWVIELASAVACVVMAKLQRRNLILWVPIVFLSNWRNDLARGQSTFEANPKRDGMTLHNSEREVAYALSTSISACAAAGALVPKMRLDERVSRACLTPHYV